MYYQDLAILILVINTLARIYKYGYSVQRMIAIIIILAIVLLISIYISVRITGKFKKARTDLNRQKELFELVKEAPELLITSEPTNLEKTIFEAMEAMACCVNADRVYIWQNSIIDGKMRYEKQYEWTAEKTSTLYPIPEEAYYYMETIPHWDTLFSSGRHVNGPVSSLSKIEQDDLTPLNIRSILAIPLILQENFWGFISFDDLHSERYFSDDEVNILHSCGLLIANAVVRNQNSLLIENQIEQQKLMASISRNFISKEPMRDLIIKTMGEIGVFLKTSRIIIVTEDRRTGDTKIAYSWGKSEEWKPIDVGNEINDPAKGLFPSFIPESGYVSAVYCNDIYKEYGGKFKYFEKIKVKSFILAPVYSNGFFWGYLTVEECENIRSWTESDIQLVGTVTSSIALAISRELLMKACSGAENSLA